MLLVPESPPVVSSNTIAISEHQSKGSNRVFIRQNAVDMGRVHITAHIVDRISAQGAINVEGVTQRYFRDNIYKMLPAEFWRQDHKTLEDGGGEGSLEHLTQAFALSMDEIKQAIDKFVELFDIDHCPSRYLYVIARLLNYPLSPSDTVTTQRKQLREAVEWYRFKGARKSFEAMLYAFGFKASVVPLWTEDYRVFTESIPGIAPGNEVPSNHALLVENGGTWYRSPHFGIYLESLIGDNTASINWDNVDPQVKADFEDRVEEVGFFQAFYEKFDELVREGAQIQYIFTQEDFNYIWQRVEFIRPVFEVLEWFGFILALDDHYGGPTPVFDFVVNPVLDDRGWYLGYCDLNDAIYTRLDPRLLGADYLNITSPLGTSSSALDITGEVVYSVSGAITYATGTLENYWVYQGVKFYFVRGGSSVTMEGSEGSGGLFVTSEDDPKTYGRINHLTGFWEILFEGVSPDDTTDITADYSYSTEIPPVDRSDALPRGATKLPFPLVRNPQEGYCNPPEELFVSVEHDYLDPYSLPLTRDGMNLYDDWEEGDYIDRSDFPSRGYTTGGGLPGEAGGDAEITRATGYSNRVLSVLEVEAGLPIPVAAFSYSALALEVSFTDESSYTPTSWSWDFGDGNTSTEQNPTHEYSTAGTYTVELVATNDQGSSAPATQSINVSEAYAVSTDFSPAQADGFTPTFPDWISQQLEIDQYPDGTRAQNEVFEYHSETYYKLRQRYEGDGQWQAGLHLLKMRDVSSYRISFAVRHNQDYGLNFYFGYDNNCRIVIDDNAQIAIYKRPDSSSSWSSVSGGGHYLDKNRDYYVWFDLNGSDLSVHWQLCTSGSTPPVDTSSWTFNFDASWFGTRPDGESMCICGELLEPDLHINVNTVKITIGGLSYDSNRDYRFGALTLEVRSSV